MADLDELRERIDDLSRELADTAYERLRAARGQGEEAEASAIALDKRLGRARRALDKASALLAADDASDAGDL